MPHVYKAQVGQFSCVQEFQEKAVRFLNELFGRSHPLEVFDFAENKETGEYIATGYRHDEEVPGELQPGQPISAEQKNAIDTSAKSSAFLLTACIRSSVRSAKRAKAAAKAPVNKQAPAKDKAKNGKNGKQ